MARRRLDPRKRALPLSAAPPGDQCSEAPPERVNLAGERTHLFERHIRQVLDDSSIEVVCYEDAMWCRYCLQWLYDWSDCTWPAEVTGRGPQSDIVTDPPYRIRRRRSA